MKEYGGLVKQLCLLYHCVHAKHFILLSLSLLVQQLEVNSQYLVLGRLQA